MGSDQPPRVTDAGLSPRFIAARQGEMFYHGKPCKKCQATERYVSTGNCRACQIKTIKLLRLRQKEEKGRAMREAPVMIEPPQQHGENSGA